jgi:hypothetical protein
MLGRLRRESLLRVGIDGGSPHRKLVGLLFLVMVADDGGAIEAESWPEHEGYAQIKRRGSEF